MSNMFPPLVSSSPPPMLPDEDDEDEFGDFATNNDFSYDDDLSLPTSPQKINSQPLSVAYQNNDSENSKCPNEEIKSVNDVEFKDNTSQNSVISIVTSDSGLSDIHSSASDDPSANTINVEHLQSKDFLDVRNSDIISNSNNIPILDECEDKQINIDEDNKDFKDKRKIDIEKNDNSYIINNQLKQTELNEENVLNFTDFDNHQENSCEIELELERISNELNNLEINEPTDEKNQKTDDEILEDVENMLNKIDSENNQQDDDFADFESHISNQVNDDFAEFQTANDCDDEFDDFCEFSQAPTITTKVQLNSQIEQKSAEDLFQCEIIDIFSKWNESNKEKIGKIISDVFNDAFKSKTDDDISQTSETIPLFLDTLTNLNVWKYLEDIENLKPLKYQWENSLIYEKYLKIINIDTRNILYGPNTNMPRFAATLGGSPLEPLKPTLISNAVDKQLSNEEIKKSTNKPDDVSNNLPPAHFDWSDSGLVNPLEYNSTKDDNTEINTKETKENNNDIYIDSTKEQTVDVKQESESVKSLKFSDFGFDNRETIKDNSIEMNNINDDNKIDNDEDDDFSEFHSSALPSMSLPKMNLRETHISSIDTDSKPAWIEPTVNQNVEVNNDEFTDFQFADNITSTNVTILEPIKLQSDIKTSQSQNVEINWPDPGISDDELQRLSNLRIDTMNKVVIDEKQTTKIEVDEDDWSDFVSVTNQATSQDKLEKTDVETLFPKCVKYSPVLNKPIQNISSQPQPIIANTKGNLLDLQNLVNTQTILSPVPFVKQSTTKSDQTDDDWSDFVSNRDTNNQYQYKNGWEIKSQPPIWSNLPNFPSWNAPMTTTTTFTPNIITNPGHFDLTSSYAHTNGNVLQQRNDSVYVTATTNRNQTHTTLQTVRGNKNTISTISSLPDLEFMTPKSIMRSKNGKK